jgi:hypothetical protein
VTAVTRTRASSISAPRTIATALLHSCDGYWSGITAVSVSQRFVSSVVAIVVFGRATLTKTTSVTVSGPFCQWRRSAAGFRTRTIPGSVRQTRISPFKRFTPICWHGLRTGSSGPTRRPLTPTSWLTPCSLWTLTLYVRRGYRPPMRKRGTRGRSLRRSLHGSPIMAFVALSPIPAMDITCWFRPSRTPARGLWRQAGRQASC